MKEINASDFQKEVLEAPEKVLVDFFASWCGPCQGMMPVLENLEGQLPAGTKVVKIDVDQAPEIAGQYGVMSIPSFKVFQNGEVVSEALGMQSVEQVLTLLA